MATHESPSLPIRYSRRLSEHLGSYEGGCLHSPVWIGVLTIFLEMSPKAMTLSLIANLQKQQFGDELYWLSIGPMILQAILSMPALALGGYLSQPHRVGRKRVMLFFICVSTISGVVPALTEDAYVITVSQIVFSLLGCDKMNSGFFVIVISWCTDWCRPSEKSRYFGVLIGCMFGTISISPYIPSWFQIKSTQSIFLFAALFKVAGPVFVMLFFPKASHHIDHDGDLPSPTALSRRFSTSPGFVHEPNQAPPRSTEVSASSLRGVRKTLHHVCCALQYLFTKRFAATFVYVMINLSDAAVQDIVAVFLFKERSFSLGDINALICIIGAFGFFMQTLGVPFVSSWGASSELLLVVGVLSMVVHFGVYAFVARPLYILILEPFGSLGYVAVIASMAIVSGTSGKDDVPRDQGTLIATLNGIKLVASCVGPLIIAAFTSYWKQFPQPLNFPGVGFAALSAMMLLALVPAFRLWCLVKRS